MESISHGMRQSWLRNQGNKSLTPCKYVSVRRRRISKRNNHGRFVIKIQWKMETDHWFPLTVCSQNISIGTIQDRQKTSMSLCTALAHHTTVKAGWQWCIRSLCPLIKELEPQDPAVLFEHCGKTNGTWAAH